MSKTIRVTLELTDAYVKSMDRETDDLLVIGTEISIALCQSTRLWVDPVNVRVISLVSIDDSPRG